MIRVLPAILCAVLGSGCASVPSESRVGYDPWESPNRSLHRFNEALDKATFKPLAKGYNKVVPKPVRKGVSNFSDNLFTPRSALNNFLQGKPRDGFGDILRFLINSTAGIGGLFDIAARNGLEARSEDFGQTAAVWGMPSGPYIMLPFLGPKTLRDTLFLPLDMAADPLMHHDDSSVRDPLYVIRLIDLRSRLLSLDDMLKESNDPYVTVRESYLQNREFQIYDGDPPTEDDDDLFDEFLDEEDY